MRTLVTLTRRELGVYFVSPTAYIILTAFLAVTGTMFYWTMLGYLNATMPARMADIQGLMALILVVLSPLITMRLIAEEKNRGTIETMMTAPVSEWAFVLSKYIASFLFVGYLVVPTLFYAAFVGAFSTLDAVAMAAGYLGVMLTVGAVLAIGLFVSALSNTQVSAGIVTLVIVMILLVTSFFAATLHGSSPWIVFARETLEHIGILGHMERFAAGVIDVRPLVYLLSVTTLFLYLTVRAVESRRWR